MINKKEYKDFNFLDDYLSHDYRETLLQLTSLYKILSNGVCDKVNAMVDSNGRCGFIDGCEDAIVVIKSRIPKSPNYTPNDSRPRCPSCGDLVRSNFCSECGQRINWNANLPILNITSEDIVANALIASIRMGNKSFVSYDEINSYASEVYIYLQERNYKLNYTFSQSGFHELVDAYPEFFKECIINNKPGISLKASKTLTDLINTFRARLTVDALIAFSTVGENFIWDDNSSKEEQDDWI